MYTLIYISYVLSYTLTEISYAGTLEEVRVLEQLCSHTLFHVYDMYILSHISHISDMYTLSHIHQMQVPTYTHTHTHIHTHSHIYITCRYPGGS